MEPPGPLNPLKRNIELKCRCPDLEAAEAAARSAGAALLDRERQHDTYFRVPHGRLKLRRRWGGGGQPGGTQLIWYQRTDESRPRPSDYRLVPVADGEGVLAALSGALGVAAEVAKERAIWFADEVRIHLDRVEGLGSFLEFEAIVGPDGDAPARDRLDRLARALGVTGENILRASYGDLVLGKGS